ncbi:hypothetical protein BCR34DRAFT_475349 [Clohesyomyces aquaticus]|uniref:Uncharacterized protein n=1 Tax=Clohesyomyces aquaticus TaxID=1231657 RepID=A0A1Y2A4C6_9PLEO|nr:hypothetical protein BCR34DRAFT_475349 [Clohesyomyces aquaticus]
MALTFLPRPSPPRPRKRCRAVTDVDGEYSCLHKKKRRLRLFLITSRLSPQFSHPATNIVDRGNSKIAVWAKQRALGRNLLRKAAILNRIRRRAIKAKETGEGLGRVLVEQEREQKQLELARLAFVYGSHDPHSRPETPTFRSPNDAYSYAPRTAQIPRKSYIPLPPSPLGLSNYDAFDLDDDIPDPYSHLDDDGDESHNEDMHDADPRSPSANTSVSFSSTLSTAATGTSETLRTPPQMIYSDFSILDPGEPVVGDYDGIDDGADTIWPNALAPETKKTQSSPGSSPRLQPQSGSLLPASSSPNFTAIFATASLNDTSSFYPSDTAGIEALGRKEAEMKQERDRQKNLMFLRFNS